MNQTERIAHLTNVPWRLPPGRRIRLNLLKQSGKMRKMTTEQVAAIKADFAAGMTLTAVARKHGRPVTTVRQIGLGLTYTDVPWPVESSENS